LNYSPHTTQSIKGADKLVKINSKLEDSPGIAISIVKTVVMEVLGKRS